MLWGLWLFIRQNSQHYIQYRHMESSHQAHEAGRYQSLTDIAREFRSDWVAHPSQHLLNLSKRHPATVRCPACNRRGLFGAKTKSVRHCSGSVIAEILGSLSLPKTKPTALIQACCHGKIGNFLGIWGYHTIFQRITSHDYWFVTEAAYRVT